MKQFLRFTLATLFGLLGIIDADVTPVVQPTHSCSDIEKFLLNAHTGTLRSISAGVTGTHRMTLDDGSLRHDAHLQTIDEKKTSFQGSNGTTELNFRDSYKYNIAAYELVKLLRLNMMPPYVERSVAGNKGSLSCGSTTQ